MTGTAKLVPTPGPVPSIHDEYLSLRRLAESAGDVSSLTALERSYPKVLLLASASYLEVVVCEEVLGLYAKCPQPLIAFVDKQGLARRYHTLFDWSGQHATKFFALFGADVKARYSDRFSRDDEFAAVVRAFMEIGSIRNALVHDNFGDFQLAKTATEVYDLHTKAVDFPPLISAVVANSASGQTASEAAPGAE